MTYVCSPLSAATRAAMLSNAAKAKNYMGLAEQEFWDRAVAPHAFLPYLLMMVFRRNELWQLRLARNF